MNLGPMEIGVLLIVMLFVFGPKRIPELGKSIGEALTGFRKATSEGLEPATKSEPKLDSKSEAKLDSKPETQSAPKLED